MLPVRSAPGPVQKEYTMAAPRAGKSTCRGGSHDGRSVADAMGGLHGHGWDYGAATRGAQNTKRADSDHEPELLCKLIVGSTIRLRVKEGDELTMDLGLRTRRAVN